MSYQKLIILGNVGREPELRYTPNGTAVTDFSVATNRKWKNADGSLNEETCWFKVTCWGKLAERMAEYITKGRSVLVDGRLVPDSATGGPRVYERNAGGHGATFEVTADNVTLVGGRSDTGGGSVAAGSGDLDDDVF